MPLKMDFRLAKYRRPSPTPRKAFQPATTQALQPHLFLRVGICISSGCA